MCESFSTFNLGEGTGTPGGWSSGQVRSENTDERDERPPARDGRREGTLGRELSVDVCIPRPFVMLTGDHWAGRRRGKRDVVALELGSLGLDELFEGVDGDGGGSSLGVAVVGLSWLAMSGVECSGSATGLALTASSSASQCV